MKYILHPQQNNKLAITVPCGDVNIAIKKSIPANTPHTIVDSLSGIHNEFFDAYEYHATEGAVVNMSKANDIKRNQFRAARKPLLEKLDVEYMKATEAGDTAKQKTITAQKQALRDLPAVQLPSDIDSLAKFLPAALK